MYVYIYITPVIGAKTAYWCCLTSYIHSLCYHFTFPTSWNPDVFMCICVYIYIYTYLTVIYNVFFRCFFFRTNKNYIHHMLLYPSIYLYELFLICLINIFFI